ncbi:universal stress protein [Facilibium subflavum]|uniref:universal stress protein n=1 Tax=Facilibium subflavum TaxID=2219058 RepID=UPI0013C2D00C|nr:universal stress protein [Facilibium subflavum]
MHYQKILVAINIYEDYNHVIDSAKAFAEKVNAPVDVVTVIDNAAEFVPAAIDFQRSLQENAKEKLETIKPRLEGIKASYHILEGNPNHQITHYANENHCDLIIIGSHGRHGINLLLGSTANSVLHKSKCDVLTVRIRENNPNKVLNYKKTLLATDLEDDSQEVAKLAQVISKLFDAQVSTITVQGDPTVVTGIYGIVPEVQTKIAEDIQDKLDDWSKQYGFNGKHYNNTGNAADEITQTANDESYGLIVLGSHQRGALGRFFLGSTANAVLHHAKQDVLIKKLK